ncbi:hypothetical protein [Streptomyces phaeochromogenes]|uniref:hypothetical protein n=1 Tax=Streptomyces phaeochromogenes TaxID=1923 RepID=UPI003864E57F|nr:hypothetical protein OHB08_01670 [Streptomyces phaeochromogenes]
MASLIVAADEFHEGLGATKVGENGLGTGVAEGCLVACIDAASLAPQLVLAGHAPADIARLLRDHPATADSPDTTTAFLAALTGHWHRNARKPAPPGAPGLRAYQQRAAAAGLALLGYRMS